MRNMVPHRRKRAGVESSRLQRGLSLIEVLVAVVVLGVGLLGTAALQATALRGGQSSYESSMAVTQTNSILEAMRANATAVSAGAYNVALQCAVPADAGSRAQRDTHRWMTDLKTSVGGRAEDAVATDTTTCGTIACVSGNCTVTVQWDDRRAGGRQDRQVTTRTRI